jgi:hypothetical protein
VGERRDRVCQCEIARLRRFGPCGCTVNRIFTSEPCSYLRTRGTAPERGANLNLKSESLASPDFRVCKVWPGPAGSHHGFWVPVIDFFFQRPRDRAHWSGLCAYRTQWHLPRHSASELRVRVGSDGPGEMEEQRDRLRETWPGQRETDSEREKQRDSGSVGRKT